MDFNKVDEKSLSYSILFRYAKFIHDKIFYKKVVYVGQENIPKDKPVLIAPNHQNALMDALAIIFSSKRITVFLARSDIFQSPMVAKILLFLRILPVYRIRDGKEKLKLNDVIYNKTIDILEKNKTLSIFPEATHNEIMHLRAFKKGVQRVTLMTQDKHDNKIDVKIIPTGIFYSNYFNFRSVLHVYYGKPISVSEYYDRYKEHEAKAMVALGNEMFSRILDLAIDVRDDKNFDVYKALMYVGLPDRNEKISEEEKFISYKKTIKTVENISTEKPEKFEVLAEKTRKYTKILSSFNLRDWVLRKKIGLPQKLAKMLLLIVASPVFVFGFISNILPYIVPSFITKGIKDKQFYSSVRYGIGIMLFPIYYILFFVIAGAISGFWLYSLLYVISLPIFGMLAFAYHRFFVKFMAQIRFCSNYNKPKIKELLTLRQEIVEMLK